MYQHFDKDTTNKTDKAAWILSEIIDDAAPMHWTRFRFAAGCIANNAELMALLEELKERRD